MLLTILMPCYNEETTVSICIEEAMLFLKNSGLEGEVLVVDNASTDRTSAIALSHGARVIYEHNKGYGLALRRGISEAYGKVIIMGDADTTYSFIQIENLVRPLINGEADIMIGIRKAEPGAMSFSHFIGVRLLSALARRKFHSNISDFHCGIRGITKVAAEKCNWKSTGMEFATEMIGEGVKHNLRIGQTCVPLRRCIDENRVSKLHTIRDGFRHLWFILTWRE